MAVWQQFLIIAGAHFLALLSPGPDFFLIVRSAVVNGARVASGVCVGIALANGVNANQVRRWMRERSIEVPKQRMSMPTAQPVPAMAPEFVQLPLAPEPDSRDIRIEIRRGNAAIKVDWPVQASGDCAAWLRDWLR